MPRHYQRRRVLPGPQRVDYSAHQTQHTAGALESFERGPFLIEGVEELRVDRVGPLNAVFVRRVSNLAWEFVGVLAVHLDISLSSCANRCQCCCVSLLEDRKSTRL